MFNAAGEWVAKECNDDVYGEFKGEKHPLMQQYFLHQVDWANTSVSQGANMGTMETHFILKLKDLVKAVNKPEEEKQSLFMLEPIF